MQDTLNSLEDFARNYMDNILIAPYTENKHLDHIRQVFKQFHEFKMKLKLTQCDFGQSKIQFLGHIINHEGIRTLPEKTEEISKIKAPRNADEVCAFLGLLNYYRQFIPAFSDLMHPIQKLLKKNVKFEWTEEYDKAFKTAKETLMRDPILYHPDPNTPWIIQTDTSKTVFAGMLLQPHTHKGIKQEVPVTFIPYNFISTQEAWSATECEFYAIYVAMFKLNYMIKGGRVTIRTDHKPRTAKPQIAAAIDKFRHWTSDILAGDPHPTIQYKKGSLNLIADSLSRLRMGEHYNHDIPLHNTEPIILKKKAEINMVTTHAKSAEQEQFTLKLPGLQIKVWDIFKTSDKCQLITNAEKVLDTLEPVKLRELQNQDQPIINLKKSRKQSVIADKDNVLRMKIDHKLDILEAILLPKVLRPCIITSTHEFCRHQGRYHYYNKIRATYFWSGMENNICQAISNCKICKMESPNLGKYMNLHLEIGTAPMHFLAMDTIEVRHTDSAYKYAFTLIDMLTNYVFVIPVKDICGKTLVHKYIYKVYLPFSRMEKFLSDNGTSFINEFWRNLAKVLSFTHF